MASPQSHQRMPIALGRECLVMPDLTMLQEALLPKAVGLMLDQFTETDRLVVVDAHSNVGEIGVSRLCGGLPAGAQPASAAPRRTACRRSEAKWWSS